MAVGLTEIMATLQNGVEAVRALVTQMSNTFPQASALSTSATTGGISFSSSQPEAFLTVISASGATFKVALYNG